MSFTIQLKGWENLRANLRTIADRYPKELGQALREEATAIMDQSLQECPLDNTNWHEDGTPHLVDTADIIGPVFEGDNITVSLSYGNASDPTGIYSIVQHENMDFHHPTPGTKAKYLEDPVNQRAPFIATNLMRAVNLERMNVGYWAAPTAGLLEEQMISNRRQASLNKYGNLLGRFI